MAVKYRDTVSEIYQQAASLSVLTNNTGANQYVRGLPAVLRTWFLQEREEIL